MARLPVPGSDDGVWGSILNEYLAVAHNSDGTLKGVVADSGAQTIAGVKTFSSSPVVPTPTSGTDVANKTYVDTTASAGTPDADATTKGKIQLAGDLSGTAASPQIATGVIVDADVNASAAIAQSKIANLTTDLANKQTSDTDLTTIAGITPVNDDVIQRKAGAWTNRTPAQLKTDLALTKSDVGLGNVDNTSDAAKPVSTATQTALDLKLDDSQLDIDGTLAANSDLKIATQKATKTYVDTAVSGVSTPDADATTKGKIQLAGDLSGTAASPQIATGVIVDADVNASAAIAQSKIANLTTDLANKAGSGANSDITSLSGLITALSIAQGGTAATSASGARTNLGLGNSATLNVGSSAGTVAAGDHSHAGLSLLDIITRQQFK